MFNIFLRLFLSFVSLGLLGAFLGIMTMDCNERERLMVGSIFAIGLIALLGMIWTATF